jgi:hypothetical protein
MGLTPGQVLLRAQRAALTHDERLETLNLNPVEKGVQSLPVAGSVVAANARLAIDGASTLDVVIHDPEWLIEKSGILNSPTNRLRAIDVTVDTLRFRLVAVRRSSPTEVQLTFEDRVVALLRTNNKPYSASRGAVTRAEFIGAMIRQTAKGSIPYYSPQKAYTQRIKSPDLPDVREENEPSSSSPRSGGSLERDSSLTIQGVKMNAHQRKNIETEMRICDELNVTPRVRKSLVVAGIQESLYKDSSVNEDTNARGVFQLTPRTEAGIGIRPNEIAKLTRHYILKGFGIYGGANKVAKDYPSETAGGIASRVEVSALNGVNRGEYDRWSDEANRIISAWTGQSEGGPSRQESATEREITYKQYRFRRGTSTERRNTWETAIDLADEVRWRLFAVGGVVVYASDDYLIGEPASLILEGFDADGLLEPPTYEWDTGQIAGNVQLKVVADRWGVRPGDVVVLRDMGPISGRWLVESVDIDLLDATATTVDLVKPMAARAEPATEVELREVEENPDGDNPDSDSDSGSPGSSSSGAQAAVDWAISKLGDYKESNGQNRGPELDGLEREYGFPGSGQPWCAMFATKAVRQGLPSSGKTASVLEIRRWAESGTRGYQQGFRSKAKPGDLICAGGQHVVFVEKVVGNQIHCIQGNGSAGKVDRRIVSYGYGVICRPDYEGSTGRTPARNPRPFGGGTD